MMSTAVTERPRSTAEPIVVGRIITSAASLAALITMGLGAAPPACADEIRVLSAAALQSAFPEITRGFEGASGHSLRISYATIGAITQRVLAGEAADVVIGSTLAMPALIQSGKIDPGSQLTVCRTGIGVVIPSGTPTPEIRSVEEFKRAVPAARVVVYADPVRGGAAGVHIGSVFKKLRIADQLKSQMTLAAGGDVTEVTLAQGAGALGPTQISEIVGKPGAEFVGPLPQEIQNETVFVAGTPTGVTPAPAVTAFLAFLKSPAAVAAIQAKGMQVDQRR
jgi:molybdate transport system substrate-binding protein